MNTKRFYSIIFYFFFIGCSVEVDNLYHDNLNHDIKRAKDWFERNQFLLFKGESKSSALRNKFDKLKLDKTPNWSNSRVHYMKNGLKLIEVGLKYDKYLIFTTTNDSNDLSKSEPNILNSMLLVEIRPDQYAVFLLKIYPNDRENKFDHEKINFGKVPNGFEGSMIIFDWNERFIGGWKFKNGSKSKFYRLINNKNLKTGKNYRNSSITCFQYTTYWYSQACTSEGICAEPVLIDFSTTVECDYVLAPGDNSGSGGPGDPSSNTCFVEHPYIQGLLVPCDELTTIINNVSNPCIRQQVDNAIAESVANEISTLVRNIYNINEIINLEFNQANYLDPEVDAITDGYRTSSGSLFIDITFNENILPTASKEYIMTTIYHELLHAVLFYNGIPTGQQHEPMANQYISALTASLIEHFPNLNMNDAIRLSWGGLQGTAAWNNLSSSQQAAILVTNQAHRNGQRGTRCD
jgi:hypothetical protein